MKSPISKENVKRLIIEDPIHKTTLITTDLKQGSYYKDMSFANSDKTRMQGFTLHFDSNPIRYSSFSELSDVDGHIHAYKQGPSVEFNLNGKPDFYHDGEELFADGTIINGRFAKIEKGKWEVIIPACLKKEVDGKIVQETI